MSWDCRARGYLLIGVLDRRHGGVLLCSGPFGGGYQQSTGLGDGCMVVPRDTAHGPIGMPPAANSPAERPETSPVFLRI